MLVTAFTVLLTDLLIGVATGIVLGLIHAVVRGTSLGNLFKARKAVREQEEEVEVLLEGALGFHNFIPLRTVLDGMSPGKTVVLDFSGVHYVDPTVMERLHDFEEAYVTDGGTVRRVGDQHLRAESEHEFATRTAPKEMVKV